MEELIAMATELDKMERSVSSWEAEFLDSTLKLLGDLQPLTLKQEKKLREIYARYLGDGSDGGSDPDEEVDL